MTVLKSYLNNGYCAQWRTMDGGRALVQNCLLLLCCLFSVVLQAQTTGYQGKRMMFKTDLISPITERGINFGLEYVVRRNVVVGLDFSLTGKRYKQPLESYKIVHGDYPEVKARIRDMQLGLTGQYFLNTALPAPKGSYVFGKYSLGLADVFGNDYIVDSINVSNNVLVGFKILDVPSQQFDIGLGYQDVFFGFLLIDLDFGLTGASLFLNKTKSQHPEQYDNLIENFARHHGPNLYSLGSWNSLPGGIGLSVHLNIGILLF